MEGTAPNGTPASEAASGGSVSSGALPPPQAHSQQLPQQVHQGSVGAGSAEAVPGHGSNLSHHGAAGQGKLTQGFKFLHIANSRAQLAFQEKYN